MPFAHRTQNRSAPHSRLTLWPNSCDLPMRLSLATMFIILLVVIVAQFIIQPVVPLFHSLPSSNAQLASKEWLFLLPFLSMLINSIHLGAINRFNLNELVLKLTAWTDAILQLILLMVTLRNILIVT